MYHLLLTCTFAVALWDFISSLYGISLDTSEYSVASFFAKLCRCLSVLKLDLCWFRHRLISGFSIIWFARNKCLFQGVWIPLHQALSSVGQAIREANTLHTGFMHNTVDELLVCFGSFVLVCFIAGLNLIVLNLLWGTDLGSSNYITVKP